MFIKYKIFCFSFDSRVINTLIASDVIEEGIDIEICNYVIMFDLPKNFRSYVQSKGRARDKGSRYILMVPSYDKAKFCNAYKTYNCLEQRLKSVIFLLITIQLVFINYNKLFIFLCI